MQKIHIGIEKEVRQEMNNIDLVVLWVNPNDSYWVEQYNDCAKKENKKSFETIRYRDYETLKYIFRGVEKNASWINKVHLILSSPSQIPSWINTSCSKLEIHYHKEFIPINLLPTFNSNCIELFLHRIKSLSEHYILFNDDQFILNKIEENMFVRNGLPVFDGNTKKFKFRFEMNNTFRNTLDNNLKFVINYCTDRRIKARQYKHQHLPEIHVKSFEKNMVKNYEMLFMLSLIDSRWRCDKNFTNWLFSDLIQSEGLCNKDSSIYKNSKYMKISGDLSEIKKYQLVCINDDANCDFDQKKRELTKILSEVYPNKTFFEK